jgi:hypothetical protein
MNDVWMALEGRPIPFAVAQEVAFSDFIGAEEAKEDLVPAGMTIIASSGRTRDADRAASLLRSPGGDGR